MNQFVYNCIDFELKSILSHSFTKNNSYLIQFVHEWVARDAELKLLNADSAVGVEVGHLQPLVDGVLV